MTFARPELLTLAPLAALVLTLALAAQWRRLQRLGRAYGDHAVARLVPIRLDRFPVVRLLCGVLAGLAIGVAAAGPSPAVPDEEPPAPLDIAIAVDVSLSMSASDTEPSRIERARQVIATLAEELPSSRLVLVVFAGWPYTLVPPTDDPVVVRYFARSLGADLLQERDQGTSLATTIEHARAALASRSRPGARHAILVLSDGDVHEDDESVLRAASEASADGVQVWTAGIGSERGIELTVGTEPVVDLSGAAVVTSLDDDLLRGTAAAGGGRYEDVTGERGLSALVAELRASSGESTRESQSPRSTAFWLTLLAIPLLLWEGALDAGKGRLQADRERAA